MDDDGVSWGDEPVPARHRRGWVLASVAALVVLLSGAGTQAHGATGPSTLRTMALRPAYHDQYVSPSEIALLQAHGLATAPAVTRELVCQGVEAYFDTTAERDAYMAGYAARYPVEPPYLAGDPCLPFRSAPQYVQGN
ncbi:MAG: hypothetical protein BGO37_15130 [Cellulomonas sp. 73-92]|uniref:hypothetical protein n=1 Tax=Cellulomonas sp. 73-92 TaxID=1895740 RepID=UPI00092912E0|nr:hypothetical protein [Cellulomonas sp. 73-92]OJV80864.1 MAG: hypothetical protein BGO37_15130 [Cellulomonas sp. 73-92]